MTHDGSDDFIALYGNAAAQGMQIKPDEFWSAFAGPVGSDADAHRERLLAAYRTIPVQLRNRFLSRIHSTKQATAIGAWVELELAHVLARYGVTFEWIDETGRATAGLGSHDLILEGGIPVEATHIGVSEGNSHERQFYSFIGRAHLPPGNYELSIGDGQVPVRKLRGALENRDMRSPLRVEVDGWGIRSVERGATTQQAAGPTPESARELMDRMYKTVSDKRCQARRSGTKDLVLAIVTWERFRGSTVASLERNRSELLAALRGSSGENANPTVCGLLVGAVPTYEWPPMPSWVVSPLADLPLLDKLPLARLPLLTRGGQQ